MAMEKLKTTSLTLFIGGMTCASCVANVEGALKSVSGVSNVVVNLATASARVEYSPDITPVAEIIKTVKDLGYGAQEKVAGQAALNREREARQNEVRRQRLCFSRPL
jgi:P-type Cu+ transporter